MTKQKPTKSGSKKSLHLFDHMRKIFSSHRKNAIYLCLLSILLFANTLGHDYTQDDAIVIYDNMFTQKGVAGIPDLFKYDTFYGFFKEEGKSNLVSGGRYRPLTLVTFAVEYQIFGSKPFVGHLFNILYFALLSVLLYHCLFLLFDKIRAIEHPILFAFLSTLIFVVHPIHTEAVANIKGRDEIFSMMGAIATLLFLLKWYANRKLSHLAFAFLTFFFGLLSKENTITFLAVIPAAFWMFKSSWKDIFISFSPLLLATILFLGIRVSVLGTPKSEGPPLELMNNPFIKIENNKYIAYSSTQKYASISYSLGKYIQLLFFPHPLTHDYYPQQINVRSFSHPLALLSLLVYLSMIVLSVFLFIKRRLWGFYLFYFLATISIFSNIVFPIGTHMAERFLFMPSLAICFIIAHVFLIGGKKKKSTLVNKLKLLILVLVVILFSIKTISRNQVWKDNFTLFLHDIKTSKNSAKLNNAVGGELYVQSLKEENSGQQKDMIAKAITHLNKAIEIHPNYKNAHLLLGNCLFQISEYEKAVISYNNALRIDPNYNEAYQNLGIAYRDAGRYFGEKEGNLEKSIQYLEKAHEIRGDEYEILRLLGVAHGIAKNTPKALLYFEKAVEVFPKSADAAFNLSIAYFNAGMAKEGNIWRQKAIQIDPEVINNYN